MGYGYRSFRPLVIGAAMIIFGAFLFGYGFEKDLLKPTTEWSRLYGATEISDDDRPYLSIIYSLDTFLPVVNLKARDYFVPTFSLHNVTASKAPTWVVFTLYFYHRVLILAGWLFTTLFLAAWTGLVRR